MDVDLTEEQKVRIQILYESTNKNITTIQDFYKKKDYYKQFPNLVKDIIEND